MFFISYLKPRKLIVRDVSMNGEVLAANFIVFSCKCMASGYVYDYSNRQCVDFDECNANVTKYAIPCDQKCTNTEGSFVCSCYPGYILDSSDNSTCVAEDQSAFMLVTDLHLSVIDLRPVMTHGTKSSESSRQLALSSVDTNRRDGAGTQSQSQTARKRGGGGGGSPSYAKHFLNISYPPSAVKQNRYISFAAFDYRLRMIYFADRYSNCIYKLVRYLLLTVSFVIIAFWLASTEAILVAGVFVL